MSQLEGLLREVAKFPLLTREQEIELARRIERGDQEARDRMILSNVRLVISIARNYLHSGVPMEDLVQEGFIGLCRAVDRFDWRKGYKFSTYATWWIRQSILRLVHKEQSLLRFPEWALEARLREEDEENLANKYGVDPETVHAARVTSPYSRSLDHAQEGYDEDPWAILEDPQAESPEAAAAQDWLADVINSAIAEVLSPRERAMVRLRFGLDDGVAHSYTEIGRRFGITRERVRQIVHGALRKLWLSGLDEKLSMLTYLDGNSATALRELHARKQLLRRLVFALRTEISRRLSA